MEVHTRILFQEPLHQGRLVSREIVEDDVDLLPGCAEGDDFLQKCDEILTRMVCGCFSVHPAGGRFQRGIEGQGTVPVILEAVAFSATRGKRQHWIEPVQGLNGGFLIHTEDGRMLGWLQVQPDDVSRFGFEVRIVAGHVPLQAMRLQTSFFPDTVYCILTDAQFSSQFAPAPVRGTVLRLSAGGRENPRPQLRGKHRRRLTGVTGIQPVDPGNKEALLPAADGWSVRFEKQFRT